MRAQTLPFLGPDSCLQAASLVAVPGTRQRLLVVEGPPGFRLDVSIGPRTAAIVQQIAQLEADGIGTRAQKVGSVALVRPLPKAADAAEALVLLQDSLAAGLADVDALLDAAQRTLKALARRGAWMEQHKGAVHLYMSMRQKAQMNLGGSYVQDAPRVPTFALDRIFAGKITIVKGQIRPVRWVSASIMPDSIATSHHARLPLMADALRAWSALGHDAADWLSKANEAAEACRR